MGRGSPGILGRVVGTIAYGVESAVGVDNRIRIFGPDMTVALTPTMEINGQPRTLTGPYEAFRTHRR